MLPMPRNLFDASAGRQPEELLQPLLSGGAFRLERIVSHGHASPPGFWYDQQQDEWVLLVRGRARLQFESAAQSIELAAGDYLLIPRHCRHRVEWTDPAQDTVWLALHATETACPPPAKSPAPG